MGRRWSLGEEQRIYLTASELPFVYFKSQSIKVERWYTPLVPAPGKPIATAVQGQLE